MSTLTSIDQQIRRDRIKSVLFWIARLLCVAASYYFVYLTSSRGNLLWLPLAGAALLPLILLPFLKPGAGIDPATDPRPPFLFSWSFLDRVLSEGPPRSGENPAVTYPGRSLIAEIDEALYREGRCVLVLNERALANEPRDYFVRPDTILIIDDSEQWLLTFAYLAQASRGIFVLPSASLGVRQEIALLTNSDLIERTLVLMPPGQFAPFQMADERKRFGAGWHEAGTQLAEQSGIALPPYDSTGMLYLPNADLSVRTAQALGSSLSGLADTVERLLPITPAAAQPLQTIVQALIEQGFQWRDETKRVLQRRMSARPAV